jgi:RNA polymerase sigma-70 factor (ECF subfamily)
MGSELDRIHAPVPVDGERLDPSRMEQYRRRLLRAAYALCGSRHDAEDLVQETYERVLRRPRFVRHGRDLAYLLRALNHTWSAQAKTAARRRTAPAPPEDLEAIADPGAGPELALTARLAYEAIGELSEPLRATVVAVDVVGLSYAEAARVLRTRKGTIMSRLFRAREQIAAAVEGR